MVFVLIFLRSEGLVEIKNRVEDNTALERVKRIELSHSAWEADVLPLNYTRILVGERLPLAYVYYIISIGFLSSVLSINSNQFNCGLTSVLGRVFYLH